MSCMRDVPPDGSWLVRELRCDGSYSSTRWSFFEVMRGQFGRPLFRFAEGFVFVGLLEDEEGLLFDALVGDEALAVEVVLETRVDASGGTEVHQNPRAGAAELRDTVEHRDLMTVDFGLIFFGPDCWVSVAGRGVVAGSGVAA